MKKIFVFGNPLVEEDSLALKVAENLKGKIKGLRFKAVESLEEIGEKSFCIMDVAKGIKEVQLIEDLELLGTKQPVSLHDFDLAMELKVLRKLGKLGKVRIIAIPAEFGLQKAEKEAEKILGKI